MSTLPLSFKQEGIVERHQIEGNDPSDRSFNRCVLVSRSRSGYSAKVTYEAFSVEGQPQPTVGGAVKSLAAQLYDLGFKRLRTRLNFKGRRYLAEKESWVDYPDTS